MSAWAETSVKPKGNPLTKPYPPEAGEACAGCGRTLLHGQRVFRLTKPDELRVLPATEQGKDAWVCEGCLHRKAAAA